MSRSDNKIVIFKKTKNFTTSVAVPFPPNPILLTDPEGAEIIDGKTRGVFTVSYLAKQGLLRETKFLKKERWQQGQCKEILGWGIVLLREESLQLYILPIPVAQAHSVEYRPFKLVG